MAGSSDLGRPILSLTVRECIPRYEAKQDLDGDGRPDIVDSGQAEVNIRDKFLYVFSGSGDDYGIGEKTPGWESRTHFGAGLQHMCSPGEATNPKASGGKKAEKVELEVYFDLEGKAWPLDLSGMETKARHKRPHPKYAGSPPTTDAERAKRDRELRDLGQYGQETVRLDVVDGSKKAKRYYFLLSPFRLGPKALQAALDNPDGLSLWYSSKKAEAQKKLVAKGPDDLYQQLHGTVFVVDPYGFGRNICEEFFELALMNFFGMVGQVQAGAVPGVSREHFETRKNQGTIEDLHFIATVLSQVSKDDTDVWKLLDQQKIEEVVGGYGQGLSMRGAACEMAAAFLGNWMSGPAHAILDTCVVEDLEDAGDPFAGDDKGAALCYWHNQTRLMHATGAGTSFLRRMMVDGPTPSPIRDLLKRYAKPGASLKEKTTDEAAFTMAAEVVIDLVTRWVYRLEKDQCLPDGLPDPEKAPAVAGQIADIVNALGVFGVELGNEAKAKQKLPGDYLAEIAKKVDKHIPKAAIYIVGDAPAKVSSVTRDGKSVFEVSGKGWVADRYFRARVSKLASFFTKDQVARVRDMESLGKALSDFTASGDQVVEEAEGAVEAARKRVSEINKGIASLSKERRTIKSIDRQLAYLSEQKGKALKDLDAAIESNKGYSKRAVDLRKQAIPTDPVARAARLRALEAAETPLFMSSTRMDALREEIRRIDARVSPLQSARADLVKLNGELDELERTRRAATDILNDAKKAAREGRKAVARFAELEGALEAETEKFAADRKWGLNAAKVFVSVMSLAIEVAYLGRQMEDPNAKSSKTAWAMADAGKAVLDVTKDLMKFNGVKEHEFAKFVTDAEKKAGDSLTRRQALLGYGKSMLKPANAMTALAFVGAVAGAYNVAKYGYQGLEAIGTGDMSVAFGAGIAVLGGALTITSALGFGIAGTALTVGVGMSASGVATVAGILVIIGALVIAFTADSEWEFYAKHCYFSKESRRNKRPMSKGSDHWMGEVESSGTRGESGAVPDLVETIGWNVRSQRLALERLLARFSVSSAFGFSDWPDEHHRSDDMEVLGKPLTIGGTIVVDFQYLPVGSTLRVEVQRRSAQGSGETWKGFTFKDATFNQGAVKMGGDLVGCFARVGGGGYVCLILRDESVRAFARLVVRAELTLHDGTMISCDHPLLQMKRTEVVTPAGHKYAAIYMDHVANPTFAERFTGAKDPVFTG